jgi:amidase
MSALYARSLCDIADAIATGELSSVEVTRQQLARIDAKEPELGAFVMVLADEALEEAEQCDRLRIRRNQPGASLGPLHGVPIALKDLLYTKGLVTTGGSKAYHDFVPTEDATVVTRLREAGAVIIGKTKLTEGAFSTHHPEVPHPINPWNANYWTGISSSGSGVAVAAGMAYGATGSDTGGSIRFPSSACGLVGIKPTYGLVSRHNAFPLADSLDHMGPMTRTVADAARMLDVMAGYDPKDATSIKKSAEDYSAAVGEPMAGLRIGVDRTYLESGVEPILASAIRDAIEVLRSCGAQLIEIEMPDATPLTTGWAITTAVECAMAHAEAFDARRKDFGPVLAGLIESGRTIPAQAYAAQERARERFRADLEVVLEAVDMIASPTMLTSPPTWELIDQVTADPKQVSEFLAFTAPTNYSGHPTITLPTGRRTEANLPLGFQLIGRHLGEFDLVRAGSAFENEVGFEHPTEG